jgi:hypothetical protein
MNRNIIQFELISKNLSAFGDLCDKLLFNPVIQSINFDDHLKVIVNLDKSRLSDFAVLLRNIDVEVLEKVNTSH